MPASELPEALAVGDAPSCEAEGFGWLVGCDRLFNRNSSPPTMNRVMTIPVAIHSTTFRDFLGEDAETG